MAFDAQVRKLYTPGIVVLLGACAYQQAAGLNELLGASYLAPTESALIAGADRAPKPKPAARPQTRSAEVIINRNPFDSVTGPLNAKPIEVPSEEEAARQADLADPLRASKCEGVTLNIVTESPDPEWSIAQLKASADKQAMMRRVGDKVGDYEVAFIGYNRLKASPAVWLTGKGALCQALLFVDEVAEASDPEAPPPSAAPAVAARPPPPAAGAGGVPPEIADKIKKSSETEFQIERAVVDNILENQAQLMRSARIVPEQKDGKVVGIRLFGIRPDTLLGTLGLQNGDRLEQINGFDMASPEKALEAYARLRTANKLTVKVTRRGQPVTIDYNIQ